MYEHTSILGSPVQSSIGFDYSLLTIMKTMKTDHPIDLSSVGVFYTICFTNMISC